MFEDAKAKLNRHISDNFNDDSGALISAITTGQRGNMSEGLKDAFNSTGLAHILSISGTHFGIFSVLPVRFIQACNKISAVQSAPEDYALLHAVSGGSGAEPSVHACISCPFRMEHSCSEVFYNDKPVSHRAFDRQKKILA